MHHALKYFLFVICLGVPEAHTIFSEAPPHQMLPVPALRSLKVLVICMLSGDPGGLCRELHLSTAGRSATGSLASEPGVIIYHVHLEWWQLSAAIPHSV